MIGSAWSLILLWRNLLNNPFVSTELKPLNINMTTFGTYKINDKVILLLTSDASNASFFCDATHMQYHHINATTKIFPSLFSYQPGTIIIDYDFQGLIRRIRTNMFYNKLKICCLKTSANMKTDDELRVIGVDFFIYRKSITPYGRYNINI